MLVAVISPLKTLRLLTAADAVALASTSVDAEALAFAEPVVTSAACVTGSSPYEKPPLKSTWSFGAETAGVAAPSWPGTTMRTAWARAVAPATCEPCQPASADAAASKRRVAIGTTNARFRTGAELCSQQRA